MNRDFVSRRAFCLLSGISGILGVAMLVASFSINPGLPGDAPVPAMIEFARQHYAGELWGAWLQAVGPVFIVLFALALVHLAGATRRLAGWMTIFGATTLMTVSLIEITFYISGMFVVPEMMPAISIKLVYAVQHLYFMVAAPALFFPLGIVLLGSDVLPRVFGYCAVLLAIGFAAAGAIFMLTLRLPDAVAAAGSVQPIWWLAAAITLMLRSKRIGLADPRTEND
jgi:hypothetical protein